MALGRGGDAFDGVDDEIDEGLKSFGDGGGVDEDVYAKANPSGGALVLAAMQAPLLQTEQRLAVHLRVARVRLAHRGGVERLWKPAEQRLDVRQALAVARAEDVREAPRVAEAIELARLAVSALHQRDVLELVHHLVVADGPNAALRAVRGVRGERGGDEEVGVGG